MEGRIGATESRAWTLTHQIFGALPVKHRDRATRTNGCGLSVAEIRWTWDLFSLGNLKWAIRDRIKDHKRDHPRLP